MINDILNQHLGQDRESFEERMFERIMKKLEETGRLPGKKKRKAS